MPSSLPGSNFDENNECYWCRSGWPVYIPKGEDRLREFLESHRSTGSSADCLVGVSGGKDSSFSVLELQENYGMKVEAFTYSHDGLEDFALENAKTVCRNLGVRHHVVELRNHEHLKSFETFFRTWLDNPTTLPAAMTCVACKHLHTLGNQLAVDRKIPMLIWSNCPLENPPFLALKLESSEDQQFQRQSFLKSAAALTSEMVRDRKFAKGFFRHFSTCAIGCLAVTPGAKYLKMRYPSNHQVLIFDYIRWDPEKIIRTLVEKAGWKPPEHVPDDWHSDCTFNVFKEYMFQKMLGVSYTDAFLSNQIRHGYLTREKAWDKLVASKNYYGGQVLSTLDELGLSDLHDRVDPGCFVESLSD